MKTLSKRGQAAKEIIEAQDRGFLRGVAVAVQIIGTCFDQPTIAEEIVRANGKLKDFRDAGVDEYDMRHVRAAFRGETWRPKQRRKGTRP